MTPAPTTLAELPAGIPATVVGLAHDSETRQRLLELGLLPGVAVRVVRRAPLGCPVEIDVAGARYAVRMETARGVQVVRTPTP